MILGITGCPGSGKSTLAHAIARHGWELVDADRIGHKVVEESDVVRKGLADAFGADIMEDDGRLNRRALARKAFADSASVRTLNGIVHPALVRELLTRLARFREQHVHVVVDCALIFEWNIETEFDYVATMSTDESARIARLRERDDRSEDVIRGMMAAQLPEREKMLRADIVLKNDRDALRLEAFGRMLASLPGD